MLTLGACLPSPSDGDGVSRATSTAVSLPVTWTARPSFETESVRPSTTAPAASTESMPSSEFSPFEGFDMVDSRAGWAWGYIPDRGMTFWRTSDGGQTWKEVTPAARAWRFVYALDAQTAWALVCPSPSGDCQPTLARTIDGGESWAVFPQPLRATNPSFRFQSNHSGWMINFDVGAGNGFWRFYRTGDGGRNWEAVEILSDPDGGDTDFGYQTCSPCGDLVYMDADRLMELEGSLGGVLKEGISLWISFNQGESWQEVILNLPAGSDQPVQYHAYRPVFFEDGAGILAYELSGTSDEPSTIVFYTSQDSLHWTPLSWVENAGYIQRWNEMQILSRQVIFFACGSELCLSRDGARTWERLTSNLNFDDTAPYPRVDAFDFVDGQTGWALVAGEYGSYSLWRTTDGSRSWSELQLEFILP